MNQEILTVKVAQEIQNGLEEHGKKLNVLAQLIREANGDMSWSDDFSYNLGNLILDWHNEQKTIIENAVKKVESCKEYTVYRAEVIHKNIQDGAPIESWNEEINEILHKLQHAIDTYGKKSCTVETCLLDHFTRYSSLLEAAYCLRREHQRDNT